MYKYISNILKSISLLFLVIATTSCGRISLSLTDAPIDTAEAVVIVFTGVEVQPVSGDFVKIEFQSPKSIDLKTLVNGVTDSLLQDEAIPKDSYSGVELKIDIDASYVTVNRVDSPLRIPADAADGLTVRKNFEILTGSDNRFIIDFDLRTSLYDPEGGNNDYVLRPSLRMVDETLVGTIAGNVDASLLSSDSNCFDNVGAVTAVVYVFNGHSISADDIDGISPDPVTTARVNAGLSYTVPFLEEGDYTLSLTCEAIDDNPSTNDNIQFLRNAKISIITAQQTNYNFTF